jgi:hypothetical protein
LLVPDPLLLEPVPEPLLEEPMPLLLGLVLLLPDDDGLLLDGLLLDGLLLDEPEVPPLEVLLSDLNAASHSWREIEPSLFLSTDENVGVAPLAPVEALGEAEELLDVPPEELLGEAEELLGEAEELLLGEDELGEADEELEAPPDALPEDLLSVALGLALEAPVPDEVL